MGGLPGAQRLDRRGAKAYQWALEAALSVPVGFALGYGADVWLHTSPAGLIVGGAVGFAALVRQVLRLRSLVEETAEEARNATPLPDEPEDEDPWNDKER